MNRLIARIGATIALVAAITALRSAAGAQQQVSVVVNGQTLSFDQPPVERAGRVFVPLRGVFERLGATVVYQNGQINATGNGRAISLNIGSTQATVNGQPQTLDVAPFLIGARTLVPLRFVAQALGASVNWYQATSTVIIGSGNGATASYVPPPNPSFFLTNRRPTGTVNTLDPSIHANFSEPVRTDSLRVSIDGADVTNQVYSNQTGFDVTPQSSLASGTHQVSVSGITQAGASFARRWSFATSGVAGGNFLRNISPAPNSQITPTFTFAGHTAPNARVHVVASGSQSALLGLFQIGTGTYQADVQADARGYFATQVSLSGQMVQIRVVVQSVAPGGASIERSFSYTV